MAAAKKCDRCGHFYEEVEPTALGDIALAMERLLSPGSVYTRQLIVEKSLDLCPDCSKSLTRWLKGKEG